jgi:hypothetical protein
VLNSHRFSVIMVGAILIAVLGARPYASSWNDGSRLASVESLVDQHTWAIDDSIFVKVPPDDQLNPYSLEIPSTSGTMDKMLIGGHFYSDKPPVVTLYLAAVYWVAQKLTGLTAAQHPHVFVYLMTVMSAGLGYVIGVVCIWFLALRLGISANAALLVTLSFGAATIAPVYARHVNNNIMMLAVFAAVFLAVSAKQKHAAPLGLLVGMAYTLDLGVGPVLVLATLTYGCLKWRNLASPLVCALAMLPFMALHHWLNYRIGGTFGPANANPRYFDYPGSAFSPGNMTGVWAHDSVWSLIQYATGLLVGPHGFLLYNLPLFVIPFGALSAWRAFPERRLELLFATLLCAGTWALYALASNNYSGLASSIRWFVPLLVPAYFGLMLALKARPDLVVPFKILTEFGFILTAVLFWVGPWRNPNPLFFRVIVTLALAALFWSLWRRPKTAALSLPASP